jgi:maltose O-acetyltransferase
MIFLLKAMRSLWIRVSGNIFRFAARLSARMAQGDLFIDSDASFAVPLRVDGAGSVRIGKRTQLGYALAPRFGMGTILLQARERDAVISIGNNTAFSNNVSIIARSRIELGEHCVVGDRVTIFDADFHVIDPQIRLSTSGAGETVPVSIGRNCWIGTDALILKGVHIGEDSVIAPKSVVTKSFPARSVIAGNPAKLLRTIAP